MQGESSDGCQKNSHFYCREQNFFKTKHLTSITILQRTLTLTHFFPKNPLDFPHPLRVPCTLGYVGLKVMQ